MGFGHFNTKVRRSYEPVGRDHMRGIVVEEVITK
jgi:hypothetical protein